MAVITNIDQEHLESYRDFEDLQQAFVAFANKVPFYGAVVACADDESLRHLLPSMTRRVITYGLETDGAHYRGIDVAGAGFDWRCTVVRNAPQPGGGEAAGPETLGQIVLRVPGRHNLQNALAAVAVGLDLGLPFARIADALAEFRGAERRFQDHGEAGRVRIIEDYGHHPTEIAAVIGAARAALGGRLVVVFQPHRYSRTSRLLDRFGPALKGADVIVLTDIYAAGEDPIPNVTVDALADAIRRDVSAPVRLVRDVRDVPAEVASLAQPGDVVLALGAGFDRRRVGGDRLGAGARGMFIVSVTAPSDRRFLRAQVKPGRRPSRWRPWLRLCRWCLLFAVVAGAASWLALAVANASALRVDEIRVIGARHLSTGEVLAALEGLRGRNILFVRLEDWRRQVLACPWVADATVRRSLPRTVEVRIVERHPIAIGRVGEALYLVDEHGDEIDGTGPATPSSTCPSSTAFRGEASRIAA